MPDLEDVAGRLTDGLLRLSQVLAAGESATAFASGITSLQLQILSILTRYHEPVNVSFLARRLAITSATVSDSVKVMQRKGLVTKLRQPRDARVVNVGITELGRAIVAASRIPQNRLKTIMNDWDNRRRGEVLQAILSIISGMQQDTVTPVDRMCITCQHFAINCDVNSGSFPFYCRALARAMPETQLQIDCELHQKEN